MTHKALDSKTSEKFVVRLPVGVRKRVEELANRNYTSMNAEIILAIEAHLNAQARQHLLIEALEEKLSRIPTPIKSDASPHQSTVDYLDGLKSGTDR